MRDPATATPAYDSMRKGPGRPRDRLPETPPATTSPSTREPIEASSSTDAFTSSQRALFHDLFGPEPSCLPFTDQPELHNEVLADECKDTTRYPGDGALCVASNVGEGLAKVAGEAFFDDAPALADIMENLSLNEQPGDARIAFTASTASTRTLVDSDDVRLSEGTTGPLYFVTQDSETAWFNFTSEHLSFQLFYDPTSDNVIFKNNCAEVNLRLRVLFEDGTVDATQDREVARNEEVELMPGPWRITQIGNDSGSMAEVMIFRRCYMTRSEHSKPRAGEKRRRGDSEESGNRHQRRKLKRNECLFTVSHTPLKGHVADGLLRKDGNPVHHVLPGNTLHVLAESGLENHQQDYSLAKVQDITTRERTSLFYGTHSQHGCVAVKSLRLKANRGQAVVPTIAKQWHQEKTILESLKHNSIIEYIECDARLYSIYMEYLPARDLGAWVDSCSQFTGESRDAMFVIRDMLSALAYLESEEVVHHDIKPGNILYDHHRGAVLIDFGLATRGPRQGQMGTAHYLSPEALEHKKRGYASDMYSLGITALCLVAAIDLPELTVPLGSAEEREMWDEKVSGVRERVENRDAELSGIVLCMTERSADARGTASDLLFELRMGE